MLNNAKVKILLSTTGDAQDTNGSRIAQTDTYTSWIDCNMKASNSFVTVVDGKTITSTYKIYVDIKNLSDYDLEEVKTATKLQIESASGISKGIEKVLTVQRLGYIPSFKFII